MQAQNSKIDWIEFDKDPIAEIQKHQSSNQLKEYYDITSFEGKDVDSVTILIYSAFTYGEIDNYMNYRMSWDSSSKTLTRYLVDSSIAPGYEYCNKTKNEAVFNNENLIVQNTEYLYNDGNMQWEIENRTEHSYDNGLLVQTLDYHSFPNGFNLTNKIIMEYNSAGLLTLREEYIYDSISAAWLTSSKREYDYDSHNNMTLYKMYNNTVDRTGFVLNYNSKQENEYDSNDNLISKKNLEWDNATSSWDTIAKYRYIYSGNILMEQIDSSWSYNNTSTIYTYNALGKVTEKIVVGSDGINQTKESFTYDSDGNTIVEESHTWNVTEWHLDYRQSTEYNRNGEIELQVIESATFTLELVKEFEFINYFPLHVESMNVINGNIIELEFDSKIVPSDTIASLIVIGNPLLKGDNSLYVVSANIDPTNEYKLIIVLNREILPGEETSISIKKGLQTKNGRNVTFSIKAGNISTGIETPEKSTITASYNNSNKTILVQSQNDLKSIRIIGIDGKTYYSQMNQNSSEAEINATNFTTGVYIIQASDAIGNSTNQKVVIK